MSKSKAKPKQVEEELLDDVEQQNDAVIGRALWGSLGVLAVIAAAVGVGIWIYVWTRPKPPEIITEVAQATKREVAKVELPKIPLVNIADTAGVDFVRAKLGWKYLSPSFGPD